MNLRYFLFAILMTTSHAYASVSSSDLLTSSKDPSILGIRHLCKNASIMTRMDMQKSLDGLNRYSEDHLKNLKLASEILEVQKKIEDFDKESKLIDSNLQDCLPFLISFTRVNMENNNEIFSPEQLASKLTEVLENANKLTNEGYTSFYHARSKSMAFLSDLVKALEEKQGKSFSPVTNFFMPNGAASLEYSSIEDIYQKVKNKLNNSFSDQDIDWIVNGISSNIFLTSNWGEDGSKDENTIDIFIKNPIQDFSNMENFETKLLYQILTIYKLPSSKIQQLNDIYKKYFLDKPNMSNCLYQIAIRNDHVDKLVKLTADYGRELPLFQKKIVKDSLGKDKETEVKPSQFFRSIVTYGYDEINNRIKNNPFRGAANLNTLQARIFVDLKSFINSEIVQVFKYQFGFSKQDEESYLKELRDILDKD